MDFYTILLLVQKGQSILVVLLLRNGVRRYARPSGALNEDFGLDPCRALRRPYYRTIRISDRSRPEPYQRTRKLLPPPPLSCFCCVWCLMLLLLRKFRFSGAPKNSGLFTTGSCSSFPTQQAAVVFFQKTLPTKKVERQHHCTIPGLESRSPSVQ